MKEVGNVNWDKDGLKNNFNLLIIEMFLLSINVIGRI